MLLRRTEEQTNDGNYQNGAHRYNRQKFFEYSRGRGRFHFLNWILISYNILLYCIFYDIVQSNTRLSNQQLIQSLFMFVFLSFDFLNIQTPPLKLHRQNLLQPKILEIRMYSRSLLRVH